MRRRWVSFLVAVALLLAATSGVAAPGKPKAVRLLAANDSLVATWTAVKDARGNPVQYIVSLHQVGSSNVLVTDTVLGQRFARAFERPLAGDTATYFATVTALDFRGFKSPTSRSPDLVVGTPWTAPVAPVVGLDTAIIASVPPDSVTVMVVGPDGYAVFGIARINVGQEATACAIGWWNEVPRMQPGQAAVCGGGQ